MKHLFFSHATKIACFSFVGFLAPFVFSLALISVAQASITTPEGTAVTNNCGMILGGSVVFCDTFDTPAGTGNRSGQLNGDVWGVSRWTGDMNLGSNYQAPWVPATITGCNGPQQAQGEGGDIIICNGQMREATNDNATGAYEAGTVTALTMYPKQPFDIAGRTGTVSFDVSNDTEGTHGAWPEFWYTDKPLPTPFLHFRNTGGTIPQNAFGIRFSAEKAPFQGGNISPNCPNDNNNRWSVDSAIAVRNYVIDDTEGYGTRSSMAVTDVGCVIGATSPEQMNHVELRMSQNEVDVYATDAGVAATPSTLKEIAVITNVNMPLTRGLIWIEDAHYNADKSLRLPLQHNNTFSWDNVAFDGPATYRDYSYDVNNSLTTCHDGTVCLGWDSWKTGDGPMPVVSTQPFDQNAITSATGQRLMFDAYYLTQPTTLYFTINGHLYTEPWPFPFSGGFDENAFSFELNKADLVPGFNKIQIWADQYIVVSNINIVLVDVGPVPGTSSGTTGSDSTGTTGTTSLPTIASSTNPNPIASDQSSTKFTINQRMQTTTNTNVHSMANTAGTPRGGASLTRTLSIGVRGADVSALQNYLIAKGYLAARYATGFFGQLTKKAVGQYQCAVLSICSGGETSTGYGLVGKLTRAAINSGK